MTELLDRLPPGGHCLCGESFGPFWPLPFHEGDRHGPQLALCSGSCLRDAGRGVDALRVGASQRAALAVKDQEISALNVRVAEAERRAEDAERKHAGERDLFENQAARTSSDLEQLVARNKTIESQAKTIDEQAETIAVLEEQLAAARTPAPAPAPKTRRRAAA